MASVHSAEEIVPKCSTP